MTDAEIRASKWEHLVQRIDLRRLVQEGTPSRTPWRVRQGGLFARLTQSLSKD